MRRQPPLLQAPCTLPPIWPGLPSDLQQRAVRLLAQLALAQFRQDAQLSTQEIDHDHSTQQSQDSSGPS
jgi:hypothetical protein